MLFEEDDGKEGELLDKEEWFEGIDEVAEEEFEPNILRNVCNKRSSTLRVSMAER